MLELSIFLFHFTSDLFKFVYKVFIIQNLREHGTMFDTLPCICSSLSTSSLLAMDRTVLREYSRLFAIFETAAQPRCILRDFKTKNITVYLKLTCNNACRVSFSAGLKSAAILSIR